MSTRADSAENDHVPSRTQTAGKSKLVADARCLLFQPPWEEPFGIMMIEAIASETPLVALRGRAVSEVVVGGATGPIYGWPDGSTVASNAARTLDPANFVVGQVGSGYEQVCQEMSSSVTGSDMMMRQVVKLVEPQHSRVGRVDQRVTA